MRVLIKSVLILFSILSVVLLIITTRYYIGQNQVRAINQELQSKEVQPAPVDTIEIIPVVESQSASLNLRTEDGISYLIKVGDQAILMDVGYNRQAEEIPPLLYNME